MPRLCLINPRNPLNALVDVSVARRVTYGHKAIFMPLGLCVAASTAPDGWDVEIHDECTQPARPDPGGGPATVQVDGTPDVVGITAMTCQAPRAYEIADAYRRLGITVILGGIHPSALPDEALQHADAIAVGEAEGTLPRMLADFQAGRLGGVYRAEGRLHIAPARRDLLDPRDYLVGNTVQVSRGCPHRCRFCTTHAMYGGRYAWRPVDEIVREVRQLGSKWVIFADDNIFGNRRWSRELFPAMADLRVGFGYYFRRQKRRMTDFDRSEDWRPEPAAAAPA